MANNDIVFNIKKGVDTLAGALDANIKKSEKLEDSLSTAIGVFAGGIAIKGIEALGNAFGNLGGFVLDSVKAAQEQENALNRLSQALRSTGEFSQSTLEDFSNFASELQRASVFGDEVVIGQLAIAKSFGATNDQAKELVKAAANLSAALGGSLEENVIKLGKSLSGVVDRETKAAVDGLGALSKEALRSGDAIELVNKRFAGSAQAELDTYQGKTISLANAYSDLQEEIGAYITKSESVRDITDVITGIFQELTDEIVASREESARNNGTLVETEGTLSRLSTRYAEVRDELAKYQQVVDEDKNKSLLESLFSFDNAPLAQEKVRALSAELARLEAQVESGAAKLEEQTAKQGGTGKDKATEAEINARENLQAQLLEIDRNAEVERQAQAEQFRLASIERNTANEEQFIQAELEANIARNEAAYQNEITKNALIDDVVAKRLANDAASKKKLLADDKAFGDATIKNLKNQALLEQQVQNTRLAAAQGFLGAGITLAKEGSREQKALQIAQATVSTYTAANQALSSPPGPPFTLPLVAATIAQGLANVTKIAGIGFADGGIVGATAGGDNGLASIREGEMILNADQQKNLFDAIKGGSVGGGPIIIQIDGREIARAVRNQVEQGFKIA